MTNEEYRDAVARIMGWVKTERVLCLDEASDPILCKDVLEKDCSIKESGGIFEECLAKHRAVREVNYLCGGEIVYNAEGFNPASDWQSAGVWIEWLEKKIPISFYWSSNGHACELGEDEWTGYGDNPLLALKAASEQFLEREK
jgi:hypothetical protein